MTNNLLGISVTGLRVAQSALNTTGHNIANSGVDGYSRQRVIAETNPASIQGGQYVGNGANVSSIERIASDFIDAQLRYDTSLFQDLDIYYENIAKLDSLLSDVSTGLASGLETFFASVQNGADDPTSIPARQLIISETENLADRFNAIFARMQSIENNLNSEMRAAVTEVNALTKNIASLNQKVSDALGTGAQPNDLIDERQEAIRKLSELVSIQVIPQGFGQMNIVVGNGQNLVVGTDARQLSLVPSTGDANELDLVFNNGQNRQVVTHLISGGKLGGIVRFRDDVLDKTYNEFGRVGIALAHTFNTTHKQGINLNNRFGENFFYDVNGQGVARSRVISNSDNAEPSDRILRLNIDDVTALSASDYNVKLERGGYFSITRLSDGEVVRRGALDGSYPFSVEFDGLELVFERGSFQAGDEFKLQPYKSAARDFSSALIAPEDIAFGSPLLTDASLGNQGTAAISAGEVLSLLDQHGMPLPLLGTAGEMNPPLLVHFTSPTTYDILDNSDPGNPQQLEPPIRNQRYVVGATNRLFPTDPGGTQVSSNGGMIGLPEGRLPAINASLQIATAVPPDYLQSNFSATGDQFGFDVVVANTPNGIGDGTYSVTISGAALVDDTALLQHINAQLSTTGARAYIADNGSLAFRLATPGYGDITLQNYDADPDGTGDAAPAGQANTLLGFDIEGSAFTTVGGADGVSGEGVLTNGYPAEAITITIPAEIPGAAPTVRNIFTGLNASAYETASLLNNIEGVSANAFNYIELSHFDISLSSPLQFNLNGEDLVEYGFDSITNARVLSATVPDPQTDPQGFYDYLRDRINSNSTLSGLGIYAVAGVDPVTGENELRVYEREGRDLQLGFTGLSGESIDINDGENPNLTLNATGISTARSILVGGRMDVQLADGLTLGTFPPNSMLFGNTRAADFAQSTYLGIQANIEGIPQTGDTFTLDFNVDGASDNRNALAMANLESARIMDGGVVSFGEGYAALVEDVGIDTASAKINHEASDKVLEQSIARRNSISGVNLDEEAANLIKFEQMFAANAQVISVARDLFDRLISAF